MKKFLLATVALLMVGSVAMAAENSPGTILFHYNAAALGTDGNYSGYGGLDLCANAVVQAPANAPGDPTPVPGAWFAYAAFLPTASPRVSVITFGLNNYDANNIFITSYGNTSSGQLPSTTPPWPTPGSGCAVQWDAAQLSTLFEFYWFKGYSYGGIISLAGHPTQGGTFVDDNIPANIDAITGYGSLGFGQPGQGACPTEQPQTGACCDPVTGGCSIMTADQCAQAHGNYLGNGTVCDPNPCPPPPVYGACCVQTTCTIETATDCANMGGQYMGDGTVCDPNPCVTPVKPSSWGKIKNNYR